MSGYIKPCFGGNAAWRSLSDEEPDGQTDVYGSKKSLKRVGFGCADQVRLTVERAKPLDPKAAQRLAIRFSRRGGFGRRGLPEASVLAMHMDYLRGLSLAQVGKLYGRSRQAIYDVFKSRGLELRARNFHSRVLFKGEAWTPTKGGYYRPTTGDRTRLLHREMWEKQTGRKVPPGYQVTFKDGDSSNFKSGNLVCLTIDEVTRLHYRRHYPERAEWSADQLREFHRAHNRECMRRRRNEARKEAA